MIADASRSLAGTMRACDCGNSTIGPMPSASSRSALDFQRQGSKATSRTAKRWASRRTASVGPQHAVVPWKTSTAATRSNVRGRRHRPSRGRFPLRNRPPGGRCRRRNRRRRCHRNHRRRRRFGPPRPRRRRGCPRCPRRAPPRSRPRPRSHRGMPAWRPRAATSPRRRPSGTRGTAPRRRASRARTARPAAP
jgi:hypothetical protein